MERLYHSIFPTPTRVTIRYRINWFVIYSITFLNGLSFFIQSPSLHQFVTSSSNSSAISVEPGLGLSETWYSVIVSMASVGTFTGALMYGLIAKRIYFKLVLIFELLMVLGSGILYSFSNNGWLILLSRLMTGLFAGIHMSLMRVYILETSEKLIQLLPEEKQAKSTIKYTGMFILFLYGTCGIIFGPIVVAIAAQIPSISEFHWPGYYLIGHSSILLVLVILLFNERWLDVTRGSPNKTSFRSKLLKELKQPSIPHYLSVVFIGLFLMFGWNFAILETLQNPILSDMFGFRIQTISYVFIGVNSVNLISILIVYLFQKVHFDNRHILIAFALCGLAGSIIMTDWQSLGGDPCSNYNAPLDTSLQESSGDYFNASVDNYNSCNASLSGRHDCFWNPVSRITGDYCERCRQVCLSKSHTLNFAQMVIGMTLIVSYISSGRILVTTIASDVVQENRAQPAFLFGLLVAGADLARATGPLWANPAYLIVDHRTWLPMSVMNGLQFIGLCMLVVFYQKMKKKVKTESTVSGQTPEDAMELLEMTEEEMTEEADL